MWGNGIVAFCGSEDLSGAPGGVGVLVVDYWQRRTFDTSVGLEYLACLGER